MSANGNTAPRDANQVPALLGTSSSNGEPVTIYANPTTHRLLVDAGSTNTLSVTDGITTVTPVTTIDFTSGATITNGGAGIADVAISAGSGTVTTVSVVSANGLAGTVATPTTTPAITLTTTVNSPVLAGNGTAIAAATTTGSGSTVVLATSPTVITPTFTNTATVSDNTTGMSMLLLSGGASSGPSGIPSISFETSRGTVVSPTAIVNGDALGGFFGVPYDGTSYKFNAYVGFVADTTSQGTSFEVDTGSGGTRTKGFQVTSGQHIFLEGVTSTGATGTGRFVFDTSPTLTTPTLGVATATSINKMAITAPATSSTLAVANGKTATISNTLTLAGTDSTTMTFPSTSQTVAGLTATQTVTNKRITRRVVATTQAATPAINTDNTDMASITGLAQAITSFTTSLTGTPVQGDFLEVQITDNGTARAITWGTSFAASTVALPTTTVISTLLHVLFEWDNASSKWVCCAVA